MKHLTSPFINSKGFMNIGMALGVAMVIATFMAPLGLYYLNMYNENQKARLRTQASEVVEGIGKMIYNSYASASTNPLATCPTGANGYYADLVAKPVAIGGGSQRGQNLNLIYLSGRKDMMGLVSGVVPPSAPDGTGSDGQGKDEGKGQGQGATINFCLPSDGVLCQEMGGRDYCVDFSKLEIAHLDPGNGDSPQVAHLPVTTTKPEIPVWDQLRWRMAPLAEKTASFMDRAFGGQGSAAYSEAHAVLESFGNTVPSPGTHSPIMTRSGFGQATVISKACDSNDDGGGGDPAVIGGTTSNHCVDCAENGVVCVRYSLCMEPGTGVTTPATEQGDCTREGYFMQGMVAMFPETR